MRDVIAVSTVGRVEVGLGYLKGTAVFARPEKRAQMLELLAKVPGIGPLQPDQIDRYPTFSLNLLKDPQAADTFETMLNWVADQFANASRGDGTGYATGAPDSGRFATSS